MSSTSAAAAGRSTSGDVEGAGRAVMTGAPPDTERLLRIALAAGGFGTWEWDPRTGVVEWSKEARAALAAVSPALGASFEGFLRAVDEADREHVRHHLAAVIEGASDVAWELRVAVPDGVRWLSCRACAVRDEAGRPRRVIGIMADVTERKERDAAHRESEARFRTMAEGSPLIIWVNERAATCTYVNPRWFEITGQSTEATLGSGWLEAIHPDDRAAVLREFESSYAARRPTRIEYRLRRRDGSYAWCIDSSLPRFGLDGTFLGQVGSVLDITDRREAEIALQQNEQRFRRAVMATPLPICIHAEDGEIVSLNRAWTAITGYTREEIPTMADWTERAYGTRREIVRGVIERLYEADDVTNNGEFVITDRWGGQHTWDFRSAPLGRDARHGRLVLSIANDVTERKKAEEALREADRRKDEFLAMLAHELRNPLAPIRNAVSLLELPSANEAVRSRASSIIQRQVAHMAHLVDDLLDVSRISRGKIVLKRERFDLDRLVRETAEDHRPALEASGLRLSVDLPGAPIWIDGDRTRVAQAITNVLHNAGKFTERGGEVTIALERAGERAVVTIRDTGIGMPKEMLDTVFEPFTQADRSLDRTRGGLGLGLAVVKGLVDLHGGSVEAHSEGAGRGARIELSLPILGGEPRAADTESRAPSAAPGLRVLVIEDNIDAAESMQMLLALKGHTAIIAPTGRDGLDAARGFQPEVVLCDIGLPEMNGYDVARALRAEGSGALLVAITGYGQDDDVQRSREAGFDAHLVKPIDFAALEEMLRKRAAALSRAA